MDQFDICVVAVKKDGETAKTLADSLRRYRLPAGVALPDPGASYRRVVVDASGSALGPEEKERLEAALEEKTERWVYLSELAEQIEAQGK